MNEQPFYGPLIQDNPGEPMLSQRRDLLEQPLDFYEPDVLPATQPIVSKHCRKTQWFGRPQHTYIAINELYTMRSSYFVNKWIIRNIFLVFNNLCDKINYTDLQTVLRLTLMIFGSVNESLRRWTCSRSFNESTTKSSDRVEIWIRHVRPWYVRYEWC